jgi:hypothetical protein
MKENVCVLQPKEEYSSMEGNMSSSSTTSNKEYVNDMHKPFSMNNISRMFRVLPRKF